MIVNLPDVILKHLQSFLSYDDIHYFIHSNKLHFSTLKKEMIYFSLNQEKSREYVYDARFREMILNKVKDGRKQIGLNFVERLENMDIRDIIAHKIVFSEPYPYLLNHVSSQNYCLPDEVKELPFLPMLQNLELYDCMNILDFSNLSHLNRLVLCDATQLTDITHLQKIPHITFIDCPNIENFSVLSSERQKSLFLSGSFISDISFLRNMLIVALDSCDNITDVSSLYGIKNLSFYSCSMIRDISGLGSHQRLTICDCNSIEKGYECFRTVHHAEVREIEVPYLNVFREAKSLELTVYSSMESQLFLLKDIPELNLRTPFSANREDVYDISLLRNIRLTYYDDFIKIRDSSFPSQLCHLKVENCDQIVKIIHEGKASTFHHLQTLRIVSCSIEHVNGLGDIPTILIESCLKLHDISGLGRNRNVELSFCPNIRNVSSLATVPIVTIRNCKGIIDYSCLSSIPRLKLIRWK